MSIAGFRNQVATMVGLNATSRTLIQDYATSVGEFGSSWAVYWNSVPKERLDLRIKARLAMMRAANRTSIAETNRMALDVINRRTWQDAIRDNVTTASKQP